jgi:hypothetical protein
MKTLFQSLIMIFSLLSFPLFAQDNSSLSGAWYSKNNGQESVLLFQDGYFTKTIYSGNEFLISYGGPFKIQGKQIEILIEFNSNNKDEVGSQLKSDYHLQANELTMNLEDEKSVWKRQDNSIAPLAGVWQITDRMQENGLVPIQRSGTRKTLKILTGTRFQWFAIDPATKLFAGTGGGTYTFMNGEYTENIEFFSRDNTRVGAKLAFEGKLENGKWHHSGLSSKGDKIYEVWGRVPSL